VIHRKHGQKVSCVFSGRMNDHARELEAQVQRLGLQDQVRFVGFVSPLELRCLYGLCRAMVIPTKFEAASFPLWEGFHARVPTACSNVTSLPEQAGDASLIFNPDDPEEIAGIVHRIWNDAGLRDELVRRGERQVAKFTWERTARAFRALYRQVAGRPPTAEDRESLRQAATL